MTKRTILSLKVDLSLRSNCMASAGRKQEFKIDENPQRRPPVASIRKIDLIFAVLSHHLERKITSFTVSQVTETQSGLVCLHAMACHPELATPNNRNLRQ